MMNLMSTTLQPAETWLDLFVASQRPWKHGATHRLLQGCVVTVLSFRFARRRFLVVFHGSVIVCDKSSMSIFFDCLSFFSGY